MEAPSSVATIRQAIAALWQRTKISIGNGWRTHLLALSRNFLAHVLRRGACQSVTCALRFFGTDRTLRSVVRKTLTKIVRRQSLATCTVCNCNNAMRKTGGFLVLRSGSRGRKHLQPQCPDRTALATRRSRRRAAPRPVRTVIGLRAAVRARPRRSRPQRRVPRRHVHRPPRRTPVLSFPRTTGRAPQPAGIVAAEPAHRTLNAQALAATDRTSGLAESIQSGEDIGSTLLHGATGIAAQPSVDSGRPIEGAGRCSVLVEGGDHQAVESTRAHMHPVP